MSKHYTVQKLEQQFMKKELPDFQIGDTVRIHTKIVEGDKERIQVVSGTIIAKKGTGLSETFCIYRHVFGVGMKRSFPLHSPRIAKIEVVRRGDVRRAKLYYLVGSSGKKSKVKSKFMNVKGAETTKASSQVPPQANSQANQDTAAH